MASPQSPLPFTTSQHKTRAQPLSSSTPPQPFQICHQSAQSFSILSASASSITIIIFSVTTQQLNHLTTMTCKPNSQPLTATQPSTVTAAQIQDRSPTSPLLSLLPPSAQATAESSFAAPTPRLLNAAPPLCRASVHRRTTIRSRPCSLHHRA